jgi:hypothetical protein
MMKNVSQQRYKTPETHGSMTATQNGQQAEVVCLFLFLNIGAACTAQNNAVNVPFFFTFAPFLLINSGQKFLGRSGA